MSGQWSQWDKAMRGHGLSDGQGTCHFIARGSQGSCGCAFKKLLLMLTSQI